MKNVKIETLPGPVAPNTTHYSLYNNTTNNHFGTIQTVVPAGGATGSVNGQFTDLGGGTNYYLMIWKTETDGRTITGSGGVFN